MEEHNKLNLKKDRVKRERLIRIKLVYIFAILINAMHSTLIIVNIIFLVWLIIHGSATLVLMILKLPAFATWSNMIIDVCMTFLRYFKHVH